MFFVSVRLLSAETKERRTIMFLRNKPSFFSRSCLTPGVGNLPCLTSIGFLPASIIELTVTCKSIRLSYSMVVIRSGETRGFPSAPSNSAASGF